MVHVGIRNWRGDLSHFGGEALGPFRDEEYEPDRGLLILLGVGLCGLVVTIWVPQRS